MSLRDTPPEVWSCGVENTYHLLKLLPSLKSNVRKHDTHPAPPPACHLQDSQRIRVYTPQIREQTEFLQDRAAERSHHLITTTGGPSVWAKHCSSTEHPAWPFLSHAEHISYQVTTRYTLNTCNFIVNYTSIKLKICFKSHISMKVSGSNVIVVITLKFNYHVFCKTNCWRASEYHYPTQKIQKSAHNLKLHVAKLHFNILLNHP